MKLESLQVGLIGTNCYLIADESADNAAAVIDPGGNADMILAAAKRAGMDIQIILLTHGHFDHVMGVPDLLKALPGIPVYIAEVDYPEARDGGAFGYCMGPVDTIRFFDEGDTVTLGNLKIDVLRTPGHTRGSVTLRVEDCLFSGDTLFCGSCGRTDLPGGDFRAMQRSLKRLSDLPGDFRVYPGHDSSTTLERERRYNPFMQRM
ncbi:MAG: MBL fold metallo-hydrolase [Oscillospiraceae bacterium]|nr:MBL fold metallo-hydrolase [Oscillospiraceae bacterium]